MTTTGSRSSPWEASSSWSSERRGHATASSTTHGTWPATAGTRSLSQTPETTGFSFSRHRETLSTGMVTKVLHGVTLTLRVGSVSLPMTGPWSPTSTTTGYSLSTQTLLTSSFLVARAPILANSPALTASPSTKRVTSWWRTPGTTGSKSSTPTGSLSTPSAPQGPDLGNSTAPVVCASRPEGKSSSWTLATAGSRCFEESVLAINTVLLCLSKEKD